MILTLLLFLLLSIILLSWISFLLDTKKLNVVGPIPLPIIGNGHLFLGNSSEFMKSLSRLLFQYNNIARVYILSGRYIFTSNPKYAEPILSSAEIITKGRSYKFLYPWLGQGLLTATGSRWKKHRRFLTPAFHYVILQTFLPVFHKNNKILYRKIKALANGTPVNLFPILTLTALDNITESVMGVSFNAQENNESKYVKAIDELSTIIFTRIRNFLLMPDFLFNLSPYKKRQDEALKILHDHTYNVIESRRQALAKSNIINLDYNSEIGMKNKHAFLDLLLLAEIDNQKIDNEAIREEVDTFMFEGHDTTASGVVFALYCISNNKDVQEKIYEEQKAIFMDELGRDPTYSELQQMKYLELVIKEALRLYPSVPLVERLVTEDTSVNGFHVPKNTAFVVSIFDLQRHPDLYENPLEFRPERFTNGLKSPFDWLAFSAGPRNCIGQKFAMLELKSIISAMVTQFILLPADIDVQLSSELVLRSMNGVYVKLLPRF